MVIEPENPDIQRKQIIKEMELPTHEERREKRNEVDLMMRWWEL